MSFLAEVAELVAYLCSAQAGFAKGSSGCWTAVDRPLTAAASQCGLLSKVSSRTRKSRSLTTKVRSASMGEFTIGSCS